MSSLKAPRLAASLLNSQMKFYKIVAVISLISEFSVIFIFNVERVQANLLTQYILFQLSFSQLSKCPPECHTKTFCYIHFSIYKLQDKCQTFQVIIIITATVIRFYYKFLFARKYMYNNRYTSMTLLYVYLTKTASHTETRSKKQLLCAKKIYKIIQ